MARDYQINGETLVKVKGSDSSRIRSLSELGLASEPIRVIPRLVYRDIIVDDFGPEIPAEVLWMLAEVNIRMTLVHYDQDVLEECIQEAMGGGDVDFGSMAPAGTPMGAGQPLFHADCHYVSLNLLSEVLSKPWRFRTCYLNAQPLEIPLGTSASLVQLNWRAIPYPQVDHPLSPGSTELVSKGVPLFDRTLDT